MISSTVYGRDESNEVTDALEQLPWDQSHELCIEAQYDKDGLFVYEPPPLDDVRLDDNVRLEARQCRAKQRESNATKRKTLSSRG